MIRIALIAIVLGLTDVAMATDDSVGEGIGSEVLTDEAVPFEASKYGSLCRSGELISLPVTM